MPSHFSDLLARPTRPAHRAHDGARGRTPWWSRPGPIASVLALVVVVVLAVGWAWLVSPAASASDSAGVPGQSWTAATTSRATACCSTANGW